MLTAALISIWSWVVPNSHRMRLSAAIPTAQAETLHFDFFWQSHAFSPDVLGLQGNVGDPARSIPVPIFKLAVTRVRGNVFDSSHEFWRQSPNPPRFPAELASDCVPLISKERFIDICNPYSYFGGKATRPIARFVSRIWDLPQRSDSQCLRATC